MAKAKKKPAKKAAPRKAASKKKVAAKKSVRKVTAKVKATAKKAASPKKNKIVQQKGLMARLDDEGVICAEGYVFELERRGYLQAGAFVPEVLMEHPEVVERLHRDFVHAGSDVVQALTYYVHREKLRVIGREKDLEPMNKIALKLAKKVARDTGTLFAGDICNTNIYDAGDKKAIKEVERIFEEQVGWASDAGVDYIVAETFSWGGEALMALQAIKKYSKVPAVVTFSLHREDSVREGWDGVETCKRLEDAGADVVGLNCHRGPQTMMPMLKKIRNAVKCHVAALPVPYRTTPQEPSFMSLTDTCCPGVRPFPVGLDPFTCTRNEIFDFGREAFSIGIRYLGVCCGAGPHHIRGLAEGMGRHPEASKYSVDMSRHAFFGEHKRIKDVQKEYRTRL